MAKIKIPVLCPHVGQLIDQDRRPTPTVASLDFDNAPEWLVFVPMMQLWKEPRVLSLLAAIDMLAAERPALVSAQQVVRRDPIAEDDLRELMQILGDYEQMGSEVADAIRVYDPHSLDYQAPDFETLSHQLRAEETAYRKLLDEYQQDQVLKERVKQELCSLWETRRARVPGRFYCHICPGNYAQNRELKKHKWEVHELPIIDGKTAAGKEALFDEFCSSDWGQVYYKYLPSLLPPHPGECRLAAMHIVWIAYRRLDPGKARRIGEQLEAVQKATKEQSTTEYPDARTILGVCVQHMNSDTYVKMNDFERQIADLAVKPPFFRSLGEMHAYNKWLDKFEEWRKTTEVQKRSSDMRILYDVVRGK